MHVLSFTAFPLQRKLQEFGTEMVVLPKLKISSESCWSLHSESSRFGSLCTLLEFVGRMNTGAHEMAAVLETISCLVAGSLSFACLWYWTGPGVSCCCGSGLACCSSFVQLGGEEGVVICPPLRLLYCGSSSKCQSSSCVVRLASLLPELLETKPL